MKECPTCRKCFADDILYCPDDGVANAPSIGGEPILDARYQLERRLGQGGMGVVFKGRHIFLKTQHAIKIILPELVGNDPNLVTRFRQEALAAAAIRHQNIIAVTDFGVVRETMPYLVMEFVQGKSLHDMMAEEGAMPASRAFELMEPICAGIAAAHRQKIVHRDLKPLNVMIQDGMAINEGTKILDFGLAKIKSGELLGSFIAAQTTGLMGSPYYMAPEQWSDDEPDARADIYSLAVMFYQMLSGDVPFKGKSIPSIMKKHIMSEVPSLASKGVEVPSEIEAVLRHALEKDPKNRTASAEEFVSELSQAIASASRSSKRTGDEAKVDSPKTIGSALPAGESTTGGSGALFDPLAGTISGTSLLEDEAIARVKGELAREAELRLRLAEEERQKREAEELAREAEARRLAEEEKQKRKAEELAREAEARRLTEEERQKREAEELAREAEARQRLAEEEQQKRKEEELAREAEARRKLAEEEQQKREAEEFDLEEDRRRLEEMVAAQTKANEEKLTQPPAMTTPEAVEVIVPETKKVQPGGVATVPGTAARTAPKGAVVPPPKQKGFLVPLVLVVGAVLLIGVGVAGYFLLRSRATPTPPPITPAATPAPVEPVIKAELIEVPGGTLKMGRNDGHPTEGPTHPVTVGAFSMDKTEVTNAQYAQFVRESNHAPPDHWGGVKPAADQELLPVVGVSYQDAVAFAEWRSKRDGVTYRLPTEEEWEYAARNGDRGNLYPWGDTWMPDHAATQETGGKTPQPVGSYADGTNRWGMQDLLGNVWEWTSSKASLYPGSPERLPDQYKDWIVVRGGGYSTKTVSATLRDWFAPDHKSPVLGFRLVKSAS